MKKVTIFFFTSLMLGGYVFSQQVNALFIDSTGRVGIGTNNPAVSLHVNGNVQADGQLKAKELHIQKGLRVGGKLTATNLEVQQKTIVGESLIVGSQGQGRQSHGASHGKLSINNAGPFSDSITALMSINNFSTNSLPVVLLSINHNLNPIFEVCPSGIEANTSQFTINGNLTVTNSVVVTGSNNFLIDHPLDPSNKNLIHTAVQSPTPINLYQGTAILDENGSARVQLPEYFEAVNKDFHYQLACIGGFAPVYVADEVHNNQFTIAGGKPDMKISWQVTATRNDPWIQDHPLEAEIEKKAENKGKYWYPEGYGKSQDFQINSATNLCGNQ